MTQTQDAAATATLTPEERAAFGKEARRTKPRSGHAEWAPSADRADPVAVLAAQSEGRVPELVPIRHGRMAASAFAHYRGAAAVMAADLGAATSSGLQVQLCGDAHLANFGGFASPERSLVFDINDFDETLPGPFEWDVKRLTASFTIAARHRGMSAKEQQNLVIACVKQYRTACRELAAQSDLAVWYARLDTDQIMRRWGAAASAADVGRFRRTVRKAEQKDSLRALAKLTVETGDGPRFASQPPLLVPLDELMSGNDRDETHHVVTELLRSYSTTLKDDRRHILSRYRLVDIARKVVGVGSVGTLCWVLLFLGRDENDPLFLQVKQAGRSVLEPFTAPSEHENQGHRVVAGQQLMQAAGDIFLGWVKGTRQAGEPDYYVRQLWDWKVSPDLETITPTAMRIYAEACGWTLARAHARSGDSVALASYLGAGDTFDRAIAEFSIAYAAQNERDHLAFVEAVKSGRIEAASGV